MRRAGCGVWTFDQAAAPPSVRSPGNRTVGTIRAHALAAEVGKRGWDSSVLDAVARAAAAALAAREDDVARARESMDWMREWKQIHPQFNTVEEGGY